MINKVKVSKDGVTCRKVSFEAQSERESALLEALWKEMTDKKFGTFNAWRTEVFDNFRRENASQDTSDSRRY